MVRKCVRFVFTSEHLLANADFVKKVVQQDEKAVQQKSELSLKSAVSLAGEHRWAHVVAIFRAKPELAVSPAGRIG